MIKAGRKPRFFIGQFCILQKVFCADEKQRYLGGKRGAFPKIRNSPKKAKRPQNPPKIKKKSDISQNKAAKSPSVGIAQAILKGQDYYVGKIDNDFGVKTDTAVREWQADKIVEGKPVGGADGKPDGIIGRDSWRELLGVDVRV